MGADLVYCHRYFYKVKKYSLFPGIQTVGEGAGRQQRRARLEVIP